MTNYDATYEGRDGAEYRVRMNPVKDPMSLKADERVIGTLPSATVVSVFKPGEHGAQHKPGETVADIPPRFRKVGA